MRNDSATHPAGGGNNLSSTRRLHVIVIRIRPAVLRTVETRSDAYCRRIVGLHSVSALIRCLHERYRHAHRLDVAKAHAQGSQGSRESVGSAIPVTCTEGGSRADCYLVAQRPRHPRHTYAVVHADARSVARSAEECAVPVRSSITRRRGTRRN